MPIARNDSTFRDHIIPHAERIIATKVKPVQTETESLLIKAIKAIKDDLVRVFHNDAALCTRVRSILHMQGEHEGTFRHAGSYESSKAKSHAHKTASILAYLIFYHILFAFARDNADPPASYDDVRETLRRRVFPAYGLAASECAMLVPSVFDDIPLSSNVVLATTRVLADVPLATIDVHTLSRLYERYIDEHDKRHKGQYYTPHAVIAFMWDRLGFTPATFAHRIRENKSTFIYDPAMGCGGFLLEAASRIIKETLSGKRTIPRLLLARDLVMTSLYGTEVTYVPFLLAKLNILFLLAPVIRLLQEKGYAGGESILLSLYHKDALSEVPDAEVFDYAAFNPPYVGEKGHKALFDKTLAAYPWLKEHYFAKMDYMYFFIILALARLKEGGHLSVITSAYWYTAHGAKRVREFILANARVKEVLFLEGVSVFPTAQGVHPTIIVLEKCTRVHTKMPATTKVMTVRRPYPKGEGDELARTLRYLNTHAEKDAYEDAYVTITTMPYDNTLFTPSRFSFIAKNNDAHALFARLAHTPLADVCYVRQGIVPNPQHVTRKNRMLLPEDARKAYPVGTPIFVFKEEDYHAMREGFTKNEQALFKRMYKNSHIERFRLNHDTRRMLLYLDDAATLDEYPNIEAHLTPFKPILMARRECREGTRAWHAIHWPRSKDLFTTKHVVCPYHRNALAFALAKPPFYAAADIYYFHPKRDVRDGFHELLLGVLNSLLLRAWFACYGRRKGNTNLLVSNSLSQMPLPPAIHAYIVADDNADSPPPLAEALIARVRAIQKTYANLPWGKTDAKAEREIDLIVGELFGCSEREMDAIARRDSAC